MTVAYPAGRLGWSRQPIISISFYRFAIIAVTAVAVLAPLSLVFYQSFLTAPFFQPDAKLSLSAYRFVFADEDFWIAFGTTLLLAAGMTMIAVPLGAMLAFLMVRTDVPGRQWLEPVILVPIFVSAVVLAFGYVVALGPVGILTTTVKRMARRRRRGISILFRSLVAIAGLTHVPHVYLYTAAALRGLGSDVEEAARIVGANPVEGRDRCEPADGSAGDPVRRRAGVLSRLRAVRPAARARRSAGPAGALDLPVQAHQQARRAVLSAHGRGCRDHRRDNAAARVHAARSCCGRRSATSRCAARASRSAPLKLGFWRWPAFLGIALWFGVHRAHAARRHHAALVRRDLGRRRFRSPRCSRSITTASCSNIPTSSAA